MFENLDDDLPGQEWSLLDMKKYKALKAYFMELKNIANKVLQV